MLGFWSWLCVISNEKYALSFCTSLSWYKRPMRRLASYTVVVGKSVAWCLAPSPICRSPDSGSQLTTLGVTSFAQIANWSDADIDRIDDQLGRFKGRIRRDNWIEQARLLRDGDTAAYEARFGKL